MKKSLLVNTTIDLSIYETKTYNKGETIYNELDNLNKIGIILDGKAIISYNTPTGEEKIIQELDKDDIFGDSLILSKNNILLGDIIAIHPTKILYMEYNEFLFVLKNDSIFLENYLELVSNRTMYLNYRIKLLNQKTIRDKILLYIDLNKNNSKVKLTMTKEKLSNLLNVTRPSLSRELINMKNEGLIDYDRYYIHIKK